MNDPPANRDHHLRPLKRLEPGKFRSPSVLEVVYLIGIGTLWLISFANMIGLVFFDRVIIAEGRWRSQPRLPGDRLTSTVTLLLLTTALVAWAFFRIRDSRRREKR